jgi:tripeptidyl-peptidase-1
MILYSLLGTSLLALPVLGAVHEQFPIAPNSWKLVQTPPNSTTISLSIALIQQNMDQLESRLAALSTPGTSEYGQWLTAEDISTQFPTVNNTKVITWLTGAGIPSSSIHATAYAVNFASTVGQVNHLLRANFAYYSNGNVEKLRTLSYSIPDELANDIELITPATYFGSSTTSRTITSFRSKRQISRIERGPSEVSVAASCQTSITPSCLKQMYGVGNYTPDVKAGSRLGFGTFLNGSASFSDLSMFEALNHIPHQSFDVVLINGGVNNQSTTDRHVVGEADLDVEELLAISHPLTITEFITGGQPYVYAAEW